MSERLARQYLALVQAPKSSADDNPARKAERFAACSALSDAMCSRSVKAGPEYTKALQMTIEALLEACSDIDSDIRLHADECLNRTIKNLMDALLPQLQVALLKVIKKDGASPKTLRTALTKFAELSHLVKPVKREAFMRSIMSSLLRIFKIDDDNVQETVATCTSKIFESLGLFVADEDTEKLLGALLENMTSTSATIRRAASDAALAICKHSRHPLKHIQILTNSLFSLFQDDGQATEKEKDYATLGKLLAFRKVMITHQQVSKDWGSTDHLLDEPLLERLFDLLFACLDRPNHNVVTSALETLQQLLMVLRRELLSWYRNPERSVPLLQKLAVFLKPEAKLRVSIMALTMSCLGQMLAYEPSFFRAIIEGCGNMPLADIMLAYQQHSDPLMRGNLYTALAILLKASLARKHWVFDFVPRPPATTTLYQCDECDEHYALGGVCALLVEGLNDPISTVARSVVLGLRDCLPSLLRSTQGALGIELLQYILTLRYTSYWLMKVEMADMIGEIDFVLVHYLEQSRTIPGALLSRLPTTPLSFPQRNRMLSRYGSNVQTMALDTMFHLLADEDYRVRDAAAEALVQLTAHLFYEEDWPGQDALSAAVERKAAYLAGVATSISWFGDGQGNFKREVHLDVPRANLSRLIHMLVMRLRASTNKHVTAGCYHALHVLTTSSALPVEIRFSPSAPSAGVAAGKPPVFVGDILPLALDHLSISSVLTDLTVHIDILALVSTILRRADRNFMESYLPKLLQHVLRVLNICVHVVEDKVPNAKEARTERKRTSTLQSRPDITSPRPRTATEINISVASPSQRAQADDAPAIEDLTKGEGNIGVFAHLKHYNELHELLKATFRASKITLKAEETSKFGDMVRVALDVLAALVMVEGNAFYQIAQEVVVYLQALMAAEPHNVLVCVHKLIINLFGTPAGVQNPRSTLVQSFETLVLEDDGDDEERSSAQLEQMGFFERCIGVTRTHLSDTQLRMSKASDSDSMTPAYSKTTAVTLDPSLAQGGATRTDMLRFVRLFEPLVLRAMNSYTTTSSIPLQQQIIWLLSRLMSLKVNYSVLDSNQILVKCLYKQLEMVKSGNVRSAQLLLPYVFQFLVLLTQEKKVDLPMSNVLKLASDIIESKDLKPQETLSAFKPLIQYFFVEHSRSAKPASSEFIQHQDTIVTTLLDFLEAPAVQEQAIILLRAVRGNADRWKKFSRQVVDKMLLLLSTGTNETRGVRALQTLHRLFESVAPQALRPTKLLFRCLLDSLPSVVQIPAYTEPQQASSNQVSNLYSWLPTVLAMMKVLRTTSEAELLAGLKSVLALESPGDLALAFVQCLFEIIVLVGRHFTHPMTARTDVLSQQFAQLLQFVYGLVDNCARQAGSVMFTTAQEIAAKYHDAIDELMELVIYSNPLIAVYWYQLYGRLCPALMIDNQQVFGCLRHLREATVSGLNFGQEIASRGALLLLCERWSLQFGDLSPRERSAVIALLKKEADSWGRLFMRMNGETPVREVVRQLLADRTAEYYAEAVETMHLLWEQIQSDSSLTKLQRHMLDLDIASLFCSVPISIPLLQIVIKHVVLSKTTSPLVRANTDLLLHRCIDQFKTIDSRAVNTLLELIEGVHHKCPRTYKCLRQLSHDKMSDRSRLNEYVAAQEKVESLLAREPSQSWWDIASALVTTPAGNGYPTHSIVQLLLASDPEEFRALIELPDFNPRFLQPLLKGACEALRVEAHLVTCDRQWFARSDDPNADLGANSASVVKLGQFVVILKQSILARLATMIQAGASFRTVSQLHIDIGLLKAAGALASMHVQAAGLSAIWQWRLSGDQASNASVGPFESASSPTTASDEFRDLNDEVKAALHVSAEQAAVLAQAALTAVTVVDNLLHKHTDVLPLWCVVSALGCMSQVMEHPDVKTLLVEETTDALTAMGADVITRAVDVAYDLFRYSTISQVAPHPLDPVRRLQLQKEMDDDEYDQSGTADSAEKTSSTRIAGLSLTTLHKLSLLTKESSNLLNPIPVARLLSQGALVQDPLPLFFRLSLHNVMSNVAPLVMTSLHLYSLCCNPETGKPSSHIVEFLDELRTSDGVIMRRQLLQDDLVAAGLIQRIQVVGFRNTSEEALGLLWSWLRDMVELRNDHTAREPREVTTVLALRGLSSVLSMIQPDQASGGFPSYLQVENTLSSYLTTVAGLYLHRVHMLQRFDYIATHGATWQQAGRNVSERSSYDIEKSPAALRQQTSSGYASSEHFQRFMKFLPQVIEMCLSLVISEVQSIRILQGVCEALHNVIDMIHDRSTLQSIFSAVERLASSEYAQDDHIVLRSTLPLMCKLQAVLYEDGNKHLDLISSMISSALGSLLPSVRMAALVGIRFLAQGQIAAVALSFLDPVRSSAQELAKYALLEQSRITTGVCWAPRPYWHRVFDAAIQMMISFPEESDQAQFTGDLVADILSMCLSPSNLSESSYSRTLAGLVRLVLSFVLDSRETDALLTLAGNVHNRSGLLSLMDVSEVASATTLMYSKDDYLIHDQDADASPLSVMERVPLNFGDVLLRMKEIVTDDKAAGVLSRSLSFLLNDFWPARQTMHMVLSLWTTDTGVSLSSPSRHPGCSLAAKAQITFHVFARMLSQGLGTAVAEWVCLSLANILQERNWRESCICLFSAACQDARGRSLLFLALRKQQALLSSAGSAPLDADVEASQAHDIGDVVGLRNGLVNDVDLDDVFLITGLMFFNSGLLSEGAAQALLSVCTSSEKPLCKALVSGCMACAHRDDDLNLGVSVEC
eukprot:m.195756 g.195756  ORF g.195756 m.195756 type:complete len:2762 (-) comp16809_c0_seq3:28-8313(-)